ncbi:MAG: hypothetical protein J4F41_03115, partial [Alphaproteobacteria bacterium]|nr:hypothetical protein [Alphaproteobacteria bacterium]
MFKTIKRLLRRGISWPIEAVLFYALAGLLKLMPPAVSSAVMGGLMGIIGPLTPFHRRSLFNIRFAMPELTASEHRAIARRMWVNLGRVVGEYFHTSAIMASDRLTIHGMEHMDLLRGKGGFMISAHIGNWELASFPGIKAGLPINCVYRPINNPFISALFKQRLEVLNRAYEKGVEGARGMASTIKNKEVFAMVVDQKLREGEMLDFFGHKASTAVAHLKLAQKKDVPIILSRVVRTGGCRFKVLVTPLDLKGFDPESPSYVQDAATHIYSIIESWI